MPVKVVYASGDPQERELLRQAAIGDPAVLVVGVARDGQEAVQLVIEHQADVLLVPERLRVMDGLQALLLVSTARPSAKSILLVDQETPEVLRSALRAGARQCLARSTPVAQLLGAAVQLAELDRVSADPKYQAALQVERFPRVIAVTGAKGGIGKTSIAANLAAALAAPKKEPVCLVDLYTQFGDAAIWFDVRPPQTLVDLVELKEEIDLELLESAIVHHPIGLDIILGSVTPHALDALPLQRIEEVFAALRQRYRFIVVDIPNALYGGAIRVVESAHEVLLVSNLQDLTTVTDTRRWLDAIGPAVQRDRIHLVLNRVSQENPLSEEAVERAVGLKTWAKVPNDPQLVSHCANRATPFVLAQPRHPVSQAVLRLAHEILHPPQGEARSREIAAAPARKWFAFPGTKPATGREETPLLGDAELSS